MASFLARTLRRLTGVPERLLDEVPSERPRYTGLAWIMLGTASLAAVGMAVLIVQISDLILPVVAVAAIGWGLFILGIDYLIVSFLDDRRALATARAVIDPDVGVPRWWRSGGLLRPVVRIVLATFLGLVVGESLVIAGFSSAAEEQIDAKVERELQRDLCEIDTKLSRFRVEVQPAAACASLIAAPAASDPNAGTGSVGPTTTTRGAAPVDSDQTERLEEINQQIRFYSDLAQCELYPQAFSGQRRRELGCSGKPSNGPGRRAALDQLRAFEAEKATLLNQIGAAQDAGIAAKEAAAKAEAERQKAAQEVAQTARNSPEAFALAESKTQLEGQLSDLRKGVRRQPYGLNERFVATEEAVNPWIRWGLRLLFVFVEMTPVLLKMAMGLSTVDQMVAIQRRTAIYPHLRRLQKVEEAYADDLQVLEADPTVDEETPAPTQKRRFRAWTMERESPQNGTRADRSPTEHPRARSSTRHSVTADGGARSETARSGNGRSLAGRSQLVAGKFVLMDNKPFRLREQVGWGNFASIWFVNPSNPEAFEQSYPIIIKLPHDDQLSQMHLAVEYELYRKLSPSGGVPRLVCGDQRGLVLRFHPRTSLDRWYFSSEATGRRFSYDELLGWLVDIWRTLEQIWDKGSAHGDGKPANLVLEGDVDPVATQAGRGQGRLLLIDFGSSVELGNRLRSVSPGYVPPELLRDPKSAPVTPLCDIYSFLGATLYYLCSGGVDPWRDLVSAPPSEPADNGHSKPPGLDAFRRMWLSASREQPLTPLATLNPHLPTPLVDQIATWMAEEPERRLDLIGEGSEQWVVGTRWQARTIAARLDKQVQQLSERLEKELGREQMESPALGVLHPDAIPSESVPDLTVDRDGLMQDLAHGRFTR